MYYKIGKSWYMHTRTYICVPVIRNVCNGQGIIMKMSNVLVVCVA